MSEKPKKILVVEDEPSLVFTLRDTLESEGYDVTVVTDGAKAIDKVKEVDPDLMLLDLMLPGMSGYDICKTIRDLKYSFPIIMLTARDQEIDKVAGLNIGADDYMTKPFGVKELLARIKARLRRANAYTKSGPVEMLKLGDVKIDLKESKVIKPGGVEHELSTREVELIQYLVSKTNQPISRDDLLENVWRYEYSTNTRTVDVHISKLRAKIELQPDEPRFLVTLHGVGYMLRLN
ncbi:MAG: DNA-binding response regulator [Balneolaceae bacterium]|nr:MAG: DNA-binding response regulator [Balneolaceae bacterium]